MILGLALLLQTQFHVLGRAHSHNDYAQARPLMEAVDNGFASVEADVFLVDGQLLVGHNREDLKPERNLAAMYLKPLADRMKANKGWVYPGVHKTMWVLVDIKSDGAAVYEAFKKLLDQYPSLKFRPKQPPIRFVISGDRPIASIVQDKGSVAGLDGRWSDLSKGYSADLMPWVSEDWSDHFKWDGTGPFTSEMQATLTLMAMQVHEQGRLIRFWGAPDSPAMWEIHWQSGVDWINTDHLSALRAWMLKQ